MSVGNTIKTFTDRNGVKHPLVSGGGAGVNRIFRITLQQEQDGKFLLGLADEADVMEDIENFVSDTDTEEGEVYFCLLSMLGYDGYPEYSGDPDVLAFISYDSRTETDSQEQVDYTDFFVRIYLGGGKVIEAECRAPDGNLGHMQYDDYMTFHDYSHYFRYPDSNN